MEHAVDQASAMHATESVQQPEQPSTMVLNSASPSSTNSPKSQQASLDPASQRSESTVATVPTHELTPPSSVASSQGQREAEEKPIEDVASEQMSTPPAVTGKKRTANGQVKEAASTPYSAEQTHSSRDMQSTKSVPHPNSAYVGEVSQQLRTKLTYAMLKVQNGWQKHTLDEIESIASQSPRSVLSGAAPRDFQPMMSPRAVIAASARDYSNSSSPSDHTIRQLPTMAPSVMSPASTSPQRKALAPPAPIISGNRRRPTPNVNLQINSSLKPHSKPLRPAVTQRTPSQNAAMEADAVETLLFMSTSPSNSGHFPSHHSAYSPTSQTYSAQTSPLKAHFSASHGTDTMEYSPRPTRRRVKYEDKAALIDRLLHDLDEDEGEELDRAVKIMEQHHATKLST